MIITLNDFGNGLQVISGELVRVANVSDFVGLLEVEVPGLDLNALELFNLPVELLHVDALICELANESLSEILKSPVPLAILNYRSMRLMALEFFLITEN